MSENNRHPDFKKPQEKHLNNDFPFGKKKKNNHKAVELIIFENSLASRVTDNDILRACSLYHQTQKKIIKSKVTQIFFN